MDNIAGQKSGLGIFTHLATFLLVVIWVVPTLGLLVTSLRDQDAISQTGWWRALQAAPQTYVVTVPVEDQVQDGDLWVVETNVFDGETASSLPPDVVERAGVDAFGTSRLRGPVAEPGEASEGRGGLSVTVTADGDLRATSPEPFEDPLSLPMALLAPPQVTV